MRRFNDFNEHMDEVGLKWDSLITLCMRAVYDARFLAALASFHKHRNIYITTPQTHTQPQPHTHAHSHTRLSERVRRPLA